MICCVEVSKGVTSHSPIGFGHVPNVNNLRMLLRITGNVYTNISFKVTTMILSNKFKRILLNITLK